MKPKSFVYVFVIITLLYVVLALGVPPDQATLDKYDLSSLQIRLLNLTVVIPVVLIWLTALYGFINLKKYALSIKESKEGKAFNLLSNGLMILALSLPLGSVISSISRYIATNNDAYLVSTTIIKNYSSLLFSLAAFVVIAIGARELIRTFNQKSQSAFRLPTSIVSALIVLSVIYTWLISTHSFNQGASNDAFYLPSWLVIFTLVIPYLIAWGAGMAATYFITVYNTRVKGAVYKKAFSDIARGIGTVVFISITLQLILTVTSQLNRLNLTPVLLIVYALLILYAIGFGFIARGAKKLKKIEEV